MSSFAEDHGRGVIVEGSSPVLLAWAPVVLGLATPCLLGYRCLCPPQRAGRELHPSARDSVAEYNNLHYRSHQVADGPAAAQSTTAQSTTPSPSAPATASSFAASAAAATCPICLDAPPSFPALTNCGHYFCASCIVDFWEHQRRVQPLPCPCCRQTVTMLHTQFPENADRLGSSLSAAELDAFHRARRNAQTFNRAIAHQRRSVCQIMRDTPVLLAELQRSLRTRGGVGRFLRGGAWLRLVAAFFPVVTYVVSPVDVLPDFLPIIGQLDDVLAIVLFVMFIASTYRNFVLGPV